ncbi:glycosyltransferase, partial [[Eubacterium] rectale]|nr:glycosyltransferase [Agathobacter rectalis]
MTPDSPPLVSIIIPLYNAEETIDSCLQSCLGQTYKNLEIIVIDDGSSDNSRAIVQG